MAQRIARALASDAIRKTPNRASSICSIGSIGKRGNIEFLRGATNGPPRRPENPMQLSAIKRFKSFRVGPKTAPQIFALARWPPAQAPSNWRNNDNRAIYGYSKR